MTSTPDPVDPAEALAAIRWALDLAGQWGLTRTPGTRLAEVEELARTGQGETLLREHPVVVHSMICRYREEATSAESARGVSEKD